VITYFDASALAKRYVDEVGSAAVDDWMRTRPCATSRWSQVEVLSAISRRRREGILSAAERDRAATALADDLAGVYVVELTIEVVAAADALLARHALRAGDAIQLASAFVLRQRSGDMVRFLAFDQRLGTAAAAEGLDVPIL
jgi:predicted nucleic acid-binding protein